MNKVSLHSEKLRKHVKLISQNASNNFLLHKITQLFDSESEQKNWKNHFKKHEFVKPKRPTHQQKLKNSNKSLIFIFCILIGFSLLDQSYAKSRAQKEKERPRVGIFYKIMLIKRRFNLNYLEDIERFNREFQGKRICRYFFRSTRFFCESHNSLMPFIVHAHVNAILECKRLFWNNRWNCSGHTIRLPYRYRRFRRRRYRRQRRTYIDKSISRLTRESGFLVALISGSVSDSITRACTKGTITTCGCDQTKYEVPEGENFQWGGCTHHVNYGDALSNVFVKFWMHRRNYHINSKILAHNKVLGRNLVKKGMYRECNCHGMSGSCEIKTCYKTLTYFDRVANKLKKVYDKKSVQVKVSNNDDLYTKRKLLELSFAKDKLIYLNEDSYCHHSPRTGVLGTQGRECNIYENATAQTGACSHLCCGRGAKRVYEKREIKCNCRFKWCCTVVCNTCTKTVSKGICGND